MAHRIIWSDSFFSKTKFLYTYSFCVKFVESVLREITPQNYVVFLYGNQKLKYDEMQDKVLKAVTSSMMLWDWFDI